MRKGLLSKLKVSKGGSSHTHTPHLQERQQGEGVAQARDDPWTRNTPQRTPTPLGPQAAEHVYRQDNDCRSPPHHFHTVVWYLAISQRASDLKGFPPDCTAREATDWAFTASL